MPFTERNGHRIHYEVHGDASLPPVLLVMGLGVSSSAWDLLPQRLGKFRVITFDNRGSGKSSRGRRFVSRIHDLADDAAAVLDAAGVQRAAVFGISMGGMIALELTLRHPERVSRLALGATFAGWLRSKKASPRLLFDLLALHIGEVDEERLGRFVVSTEWHTANPGRALAWLKSAGSMPLGSVIGQLLGVALHSTDRRLARITAPTLVLTGSGDRLIPPENSRRLARAIPGARLVELQGAGHAFPLERESEVISALTEHFLVN